MIAKKIRARRKYRIRFQDIFGRNLKYSLNRQEQIVV